MSIFEAIMLICFGVAWPFSIMKSLKSKSSGGKSVFFLYIILLGYIAGVINKLLNKPGDIVLYLYILNFVMVSIDLILLYRNKRYEKQNKSIL
ncbi:MAG: hypothetical protein WCL54_05900 [Clostridia bacterium]